MYDELEARLHDLFWAAEGESAELPLITNFLGNYPGTALELGCGSGRLLLPLLEAGFLIEGLDNSSKMLELCRKLTQQHEPVLHQAGIEDFKTGSVYGAITIPAFTLQLLCPEKLSTALANIYQHLHPGGGLYLTTFIPWAEITGQLEEDCWFLDQEAVMPDGNIARCHTRFAIKRIPQTLQREHRYEIVTPDDQVLETSSSTQELSWYWPGEMQMHLENAGFAVHEVIGDFAPDMSLDDDSQIITIFASQNDDGTGNT